MTTTTKNLSFCKVPLPVQATGRVQYLMDATFCSLPLYFALKGKHDYAMDNEAAFVAEVRARVAEVAQTYDIVVYPESRCPFLRQVTNGLPHAHELKKRNKADICKLTMASRKWSKLERLSQERAWAEMGDSFTINKIKSNQRKHYAPYIFEGLSTERLGRVLLLDDFIMSGNTLTGMAAGLGLTEFDAFGVFYQTKFDS